MGNMFAGLESLGLNIMKKKRKKIKVQVSKKHR